MSNYSSLKATINANVKANGNQEITGPVLNSVLNAMVDSIGAGYQYMGRAVPSTNPGTPDARVFYLASDPGTYTNFNGIVVADGEVAFLKWGSSWSKEVTGAATVAQITQLGQKIDGLALGKFYGFFPADTDLPAGEEPGYAYVGASSPFAIYVFNNGAWSDSGSVYGPAEGNGEDIDTDEHGKLQFANRPNTYGVGYKILRRDKTFASQVTGADTIYEIRYNFDINGGTVNIPSGCTLRFNGGSISNGSIVYDNTEIQGEPIISCTCTGSLRNTVVTPQMYGAKGDGVTDDQVALNNAAKYNDCLFIPAGVYIITEPITMHSGMTLYGVGRESKLINPTISGYNKVCVFSGGMQVGTNTGSFLNLPAYACTISADRVSIETADTSPFQVGDLVFICKDETYTSKNPPHYWNGKIVEITENQSIKLDFYIDNDDLVGVDCLVRDLAVLPQGGGHYADFITENICIHDLSLINSEDQGSGMYVMSIGSYGAEIYNVWSHGNTIIGSNYLVNATIRNVVAEFDGGFLDIPEINQNVEVNGCRAKRFGSRQNTIGLTFLQGYKAFVHDNFFDFGNLGKLGFGNHIKPIIKNNVLLNLYVSSGRPIELSSFGKSIFSGNRMTTSVSSSIINLTSLSEGNIICDNICDNPNTVRWIESYTSLDFGKNVFRDNFLTRQAITDAQYYNFPNTTIGTFIPSVIGIGTTTLAAGVEKSIFSSPKLIYNARAVKISILLSRGNYSVKFTSSAASANTRVITLTNATWLEVYIFASSNYLNYKKDGDDAGSYRTAFNNHGRLAAIGITNNDQADASLYTCLIEDIVP